MQPQWVFDCVNSRSIVSVNKYFLGEVLPPHLSPFVDKDRDQQYIPPEEQALYDPSILEKLNKEEEEEVRKEEEGVESNEEEEMEEGENDAEEEKVTTHLQKISHSKLFLLNSGY